MISDISRRVDDVHAVEARLPIDIRVKARAVAMFVCIDGGFFVLCRFVLLFATASDNNRFSASVNLCGNAGNIT
jgi:hypothetical protein